MSRKLWMPKSPAMPSQCVSCPFRKGNDKEWAHVLARLNYGNPVSPTRAKRARAEIHVEATIRGDFSCHQSAYDSDMQVKPFREHRQCPGASEHYLKTDPRK